MHEDCLRTVGSKSLEDISLDKLMNEGCAHAQRIHYGPGSALFLLITPALPPSAARGLYLR